ncbi:MAG: MFS transporter [Pyrinomonadaceae bacterium]
MFSAFRPGYTLFQFPGGAIADRWSSKKVVTFSCLGFSLFTALTPLAGSRFCKCWRYVSASESLSQPAFQLYASIKARWIPRREYSRAQTISLSGSYLGQVLAYPLTTGLVLNFSWR